MENEYDWCEHKIAINLKKLVGVLISGSHIFVLTH